MTCLVRGCAGNWNLQVTPSYPPAYNSVHQINVASITSNGDRSSFSNFGKDLVHIGEGHRLW
jgi:hypothetical protein